MDDDLDTMMRKLRDRPMWYVLDGHEPIVATAEEASRLLGSPAKVVRQTTVKRGKRVVFVSTVFLCLDPPSASTGRRSSSRR